jgi:hypothetical protein
MNNKKSVKDNMLSFDHNCASLLVGETAKCRSFSSNFGLPTVSESHTVHFCAGLKPLRLTHGGVPIKVEGENRFDFGRAPLSGIMTLRKKLLKIY